MFGEAIKKAITETFYNNERLRGYAQQNSMLLTPNVRRSLLKIAVIDDAPFSPQVTLQNHGYSFALLGDIKQVTEVAEYPLILCDIMGVGNHFDQVLQGASLIARIKEAYPEKVVIAYTGAAMTERAARIASERADKSIKKDADIDEWTATLDNLIQDAIDPYIIWTKIRKHLINVNISTDKVMLLEDAYVRSVLRKEKGLASLASTANKVVMQPDVRSIIQNLSASLIFKAIFGG